MFTSSAAAFGVTTMFAPKTANSAWMRSPMVVARASMAVTAVAPSRMATPARSLRRRWRRNDSRRRRKNIGGLLFLEDRDQFAEVVCGDGDFAVGNSRLQRDRVAASRRAYGLRSDRARAHLADDSLRALVEPDRAADLAGVGDRDDLAVGLLVQQEADLRRVAFAVVDVHSETVQVVIIDRGRGQCDNRA